MATSNAVRGASLLTNFWKAVEEEILAAGGTEEHLGQLVTKRLRPAIKKFAADVVSTVNGTVISFAEQIKAGGYDYLYGFAEKPEEIKGQTPHVVNAEVELDHPGKVITTQELYDSYGDNKPTLSDLLDFGVKNSDTQRQFPIGIVWKDETGQFWYALLHGSGSGRGLDVDQDYPGNRWDDDYRFLRRK
jgi:hypothetical protein